MAFDCWVLSIDAFVKSLHRLSVSSTVTVCWLLCPRQTCLKLVHESRRALAIALLKNEKAPCRPDIVYSCAAMHSCVHHYGATIHMHAPRACYFVMVRMCHKLYSIKPLYMYIWQITEFCVVRPFANDPELYISFLRLRPDMMSLQHTSF